MTSILMAYATNWAGVQIPCHFKAKADGAPLDAPDEGWVGSLQPVYTIPPNTNGVEVTAKPVSSTFWETTVSFAVASDGTVTAKPDSSVFVEFLPGPVANSIRVTSVLIRVSRFKDVTEEVVPLLNNPPTTRHQAIYGTWPPPEKWNLNAVPDAHFLDVATPVKNGVLNFAKAPSLIVKADNLVLRLAGVEAPQLFAVTWPHSRVRKNDAPPTPFLLYVRQTHSNYVGTGSFQGAYPLSFDDVDIGLFESLRYGSIVQRNGSPKGPAPLFWPYSKGVPYQVAKAGVDVVTVCPGPRYYGEDFKKEYGVLNQTEETGRILEELQAFMFARAGIHVPPKSIGKTAIAAFSSSNRILKMWLDPANQKGSFLTNTVRALYFLDPPSNVIDDCIRLALEWAGTADKRIRLYNRIPWPSHKKLLGATPPSDPFVRNSPDNRRTLSVVGSASWKKALAKTGTTPSYEWTWAEDHHLIAATMLTHAVAQDF